MCVVVDTNAFASVFNSDSVDHVEFKPVLDWILYGQGKAVYGGTKYIAELSRTQKYLRIFRQLKTAQKAVEIDQNAVDRREAEVIQLTDGKECNDQHLIAVLCVSGCRLLCSHDQRSFQHVKNKANYATKRAVPRIYTSSRNADLLKGRNAVKLRHTV